MLFAHTQSLAHAQVGHLRPMREKVESSRMIFEQKHAHWCCLHTHSLAHAQVGHPGPTREKVVSSRIIYKNIPFAFDCTRNVLHVFRQVIPGLLRERAYIREGENGSICMGDTWTFEHHGMCAL